ncbi:MAG: radical SAM family heme chaperone HemW [Planctomycetota bacterium]|nr:MAG: radical SAM family heme chaperone HemW [Planctomycetota bacterium]
MVSRPTRSSSPSAPVGESDARPEPEAAAAPCPSLDEHGVSLYVHLPFCVSRCRYCDFNAWAWRGQDLGRHVDAILAEARLRAAELAPQTVFLGGGTPSLLPAEELARLLDGLAEITGFRGGSIETTIEANPESLDAATAQAAREHGADRLSLGVQSFRPEVLRAYDRAHGPEEVVAAVAAARAAGFRRLNLDLIFAFPGQDPADLAADLGRAVALAPEHLSCYELSFEPGTPLTRARDAGRFPPADPEERRLELFEQTRRLCAEAGLRRYEVSNFARPGAECRHNLAYWRSLDWVGLGAGAAGWRDGERRRNLERPEEYEAAVFAGRDPAAERERPDPRTIAFDCLMMGLRLEEEGVWLPRVERIAGVDPRRVWPEELERLQREGLVELAGERLRATARGFVLLDSVLTRLAPGTPV